MAWGTRVFETISSTTSSQVSALVVDANGRDPQPSPKCSRHSRRTTRERSADIRPVAVRLGLRDQVVVVEDRPDQAHVAEVRASRYGSLTAYTSPGLMSPLNASMTALAVKWSVPTWTAMSWLPWTTVFAFDVAQGRGEVAGVEHERVARPQDLLRHLVDGRDERVLDDLEGDGVERVSGRTDLHHRPTMVIGD